MLEKLMASGIIKDWQKITTKGNCRNNTKAAAPDPPVETSKIYSEMVCTLIW